MSILRKAEPQNVKLLGRKVCTASAEGLVWLLGLVVNLVLTVLIFFFLLTLFLSRDLTREML